jgi:hypothetical protein
VSIKCTHVAVQRGSIDISRLCACGANVVVTFVRDKRERTRKRGHKLQNSQHSTSHFITVSSLPAISMQVEEWPSGSLTEPLGNIRQPNKRIRNSRTDWIIHSPTHSLTHSLRHSFTHWRGCPDCSRSNDCNWTGSATDFPNNFSQSLFLLLLSYIDWLDLNEWINEWMNEWLADLRTKQ